MKLSYIIVGAHQYVNKLPFNKLPQFLCGGRLIVWHATGSVCRWSKVCVCVCVNSCLLLSDLVVDFKLLRLSTLRAHTVCIYMYMYTCPATGSYSCHNRCFMPHEKIWLKAKKRLAYWGWLSKCIQSCRKNFLFYICQPSDKWPVATTHNKNGEPGYESRLGNLILFSPKGHFSPFGTSIWHSRQD